MSSHHSRDSDRQLSDQNDAASSQHAAATIACVRRFQEPMKLQVQRRNTIGGHANMIRRIEARIGETVNARSNGDTVEFFTPSGRTFVVAQVQTFAGAR